MSLALFFVLTCTVLILVDKLIYKKQLIGYYSHLILNNKEVKLDNSKTPYQKMKIAIEEDLVFTAPL